MSDILEALVTERDELLREKEENGEVIAECRRQIANAKARVLSENRYSDPKWFAAVNAKLSFAGHKDQRLGRRLGQLRVLIGQQQAELNIIGRTEGDPASLVIEAIRLLKAAVAGLQKPQEEEAADAID